MSEMPSNNDLRDIPNLKSQNSRPSMEDKGVQGGTQSPKTHSEEA